MKTDMVYEIDRQSYIQKNRIMFRWSELFGIDWGDKTADDLTFEDLLDAVDEQDGALVYQELYRIVKHGLSGKQKSFLYDYSNIMFEDDAECDFGSFIDRMYRNSYAGERRIGSIVFKTVNGGCLGYYVLELKSSLDVVSYYFETAGDLPFEAILLQNWQVLLVRGVSSFNRVPKLRMVMELAQ